MPVWHRKTAELRKSGKLVIVGITQEQHPERTRLYKQWQGLDWPILWDPFNTTGARAVPNFTLVDEHGIVRSTRPRLDTLMSEFIDVAFPAPKLPLPGAAKIVDEVIQLDGLQRGKKPAPAVAALKALSALMWGGPTPADGPLDCLLAIAKAQPENAVAQFRAGVALRMRHDSPARHAEDFQHAVDAWDAALSLDAGQYIWRRRIQQYGPWLDKPYPFYDWVVKAQREVLARGEQPVALRAALSGAERGRPSAPAGAAKEPDPEGKVPRARATWIDVSVAVAFDTSTKRPKSAAHAARVHVVLQPATKGGVKWNNEAQPLSVWLDRASLPDGAVLTEWALQVPNAATAESSESRVVDFEVRLPAGTKSAVLKGYALFNACTTADGTCVFVRRDLRIDLKR